MPGVFFAYGELMHLHIDFETYSEVDIKKVGLDNYSRHPTTGVYCLAAALDDKPVKALSVRQSNRCPTSLQRLLAEGVQVFAHNAAFELAIWNNLMVPRYGWPQLKPEQTFCTMAMCYAMALPGALENAAAALGIQQRKDTDGRTLMLRMCKPLRWDKDGNAVWPWMVPHFTFKGEKLTYDEALKRLTAYCCQDVEVERGISKRAKPLSPNERKVWLMDYAINQRGVLFDPEAVTAGLKARDQIIEKLDAQMDKTTGGAVAKCSNIGALKDWAGDFGVLPDSLAKVELGELLEEDELPEVVRVAFELRREAGRATSVAKLDAMKRLAGEDGRVRNMKQYHGASTGRFAGRGLQPDNFPRDLPKPAHVADIMRALKNGSLDYIDMMYGPVMTVVSKVLRGFIVAAPGRQLIGGDFSNVEGRGLAWLAGEEWKLKAFRDFDAGEGPDVYCASYAKTFNVPVDAVGSAERQIGKVIELACGYQGGVGAFQTMAKLYNVVVEDTVADEAKVAWRLAHPRIKSYWYKLQEAAIAAVNDPAKMYVAGAPGRQVKFKKSGSFLWCLLPSARVLCYPYPEIHHDDYGPKLTYKTVPSPLEYGVYNKAKQEGRAYNGALVDAPGNSRLWCRTSTYGGKLAENINQGICRDVLTDCMLRLEAAGYPVVMHIHDEPVVEGNFAEPDRQKVEQIMRQQPLWAPDLPISAECWIAPRYQK